LTFAESDASMSLRRLGFGRNRSSRSCVVPVVTQENRRAAAEARILQDAFEAAGQAVFDAMANLFPSRPCRMSARDYMKGLLASLERKNCVTIAEWAGHSSPDRLHYLLERAGWEERELRVRIGALAIEHLGGDGVLIFDETGDLKKGK
jgi:SRSO17 transposase